MAGLITFSRLFCKINGQERKKPLRILVDLDGEKRYDTGKNLTDMLNKNEVRGLCRDRSRSW